MQGDLAGCIGIVTGAAQGLGYAIARAYAEQGMKVILTDVQAARLESATAELAAQNPGSAVIALPADLSDAEATRRFIAAALEHGTPRVLIHNAAILNLRPLPDVSFEEWQRTVNVGIQAAFLMTQAVWEPMTAAGGGSIVYVSSRSGIEGFAEESAYCTAKHGLEGLMKSLALEGRSRNIAVNTITPGMYMHTPMSEQNYDAESRKKWIDPYRLTPAFIGLARQDASGLTGQRLNAWEMSNT